MTVDKDIVGKAAISATAKHTVPATTVYCNRRKTIGKSDDTRGR